MSFFDEINNLRPTCFEAKYDFIKDVMRSEMKEKPSNTIFIDEKYIGSPELKIFIVDKLRGEGFGVRAPTRRATGFPYGIYINTIPQK